MNYEPVIGLEVHLQLNTKTKAFCACSTEFGNQPNTQVCPICLGFPGSLPVLNKLFFEYAMKVAIAFNCTVQERTKFDRKHYYYPDLPKGYQISQYDLPLSLHGNLDIYPGGKLKRIGIRRVHMEEDAGKLIHQSNVSVVDFNRAGMPLLEIVSEPDLNTPEEAHEYLSSLKNIVEYLDVSDCDMEKGSLRCDANVSLRQKGTTGLGVKTELKNMNSFKGVKEALAYEIQRQRQILEAGENIVQQTLLWDEKAAKTFPMRTKEEAQDYRYFPEPDLPAFYAAKEQVEQIKKLLPELPRQKALRFIKDFGLSEYDAKLLVSSRSFADINERRINKYPRKDKKPIANWIIGPLASLAAELNCPASEVKIPGGDEEFINLILLAVDEKISNLTAKAVLSESVASQKLATDIIKEKNLFQVSDSAGLEKIIDEALIANPKIVADFRAGKETVLMFLVGQAMKMSQGKANPKVAQELLRKKLVKP